MKILFLTEKTFSATGAIEKVCRVAGRALYENSLADRQEFTMYSRKDPENVNTQPYLPSNLFIGFGKAHIKFTIKSVREGVKSRVVVVSHLDLLPVGYLIKLLAPKTKLILIAHGIGIWKPISPAKKIMVQKVDLLVPASNFTKGKIADLNKIPLEKFLVAYNCLDPFLPSSPDFARRKEFRSSFGFDDEDIILMAFSSIKAEKNSLEYDKILITLKKLQALCPRLRFLCVGKYSEEEKKRLDLLSHDLGIEYDVIFTGFVPESIIGEYFNMADIYITPGEREVFGFPFLEALYYNKPVIAGKINEDTSQGYEEKMGHFIDISNQEEMIAAVKNAYDSAHTFRHDRKLLIDKFSFPAFKNKWKDILTKLS